MPDIARPKTVVMDQLTWLLIELCLLLNKQTLPFNVYNIRFRGHCTNTAATKNA